VPFFEDPVMARSRYWLISTSHLTNELFDGWGWGEVVPEGLGIAYSIKNQSMQFNIACRKQPDGCWARLEKPVDGRRPRCWMRPHSVARAAS
jgi:hypothetical protein